MINQNGISFMDGRKVCLLLLLYDSLSYLSKRKRASNVSSGYADAKVRLVDSMVLDCREDVVEIFGWASSSSPQNTKIFKINF